MQLKLESGAIWPPHGDPDYCGATSNLMNPGCAGHVTAANLSLGMFSVKTALNILS
jgi:hypothetical protein